MSAPIDLIIFDLDGTLVDSRRDLAIAVNHARQKFDLPPLAIDTVMGNIGDGVRMLLQRSFPQNLWPHLDRAISCFREHYREHLTDHTPLYPGVEETLQALSGSSCFVLSNKPEVYSKQILKNLGIASHFEAVFGGDSFAAMKPAPVAILHILETHERPAEHALIVGDGTTDILAGKNAGICTCAVLYGYKTRSQLMALHPDLHIERLPQLLDRLT